MMIMFHSHHHAKTMADPDFASTISLLASNWNICPHQCLFLFSEVPGEAADFCGAYSLFREPVLRTNYPWAASEDYLMVLSTITSKVSLLNND